MVAGKEMVEKLSRDEYLPLRLAEVNAVLEASIVGQLVPLLCAGLGGHRVCSYKLAGDIMLNMQQIIADVNEVSVHSHRGRQDQSRPTGTAQAAPVFRPIIFVYYLKYYGEMSLQLIFQNFRIK